MVECPSADGDDAIRNLDTGQARAVLEGISANGGQLDVLAEIDSSQFRATAEGLVPDRGNTIRNLKRSSTTHRTDTRQVRAIGECQIADGGQLAVLAKGIFYFRRVNDILFIFIGVIDTSLRFLNFSDVSTTYCLFLLVSLTRLYNYEL